MNFIIVVRNPRTGRLLAITDSEHDETVAEWPSESQAQEAAREIPVCKAWDYEVLEVLA